MIRLIIGAAFIYALYINLGGSCEEADQLGCFKSTDTLVIAFVLYLLVGFLFFFKKWFRLFSHRAHYRVKRLKFGFISMFLLMAGAGIIVLAGMRFLN